MKQKYSIQEGLESLDRIRLMMEYDLKKTLQENELLNEITKSKWYSCIENVRKLSGKGTTNVNLDVQDQVQQFNQDGSFLLYKKTPQLVLLYKGKWKCKGIKGYTIILEDGNTYDSNKSIWSGPNKSKEFKMSAAPQKPNQQTNTNLGANNEWSFYEPTPDKGFQLVDIDGRSVAVKKPEGSFWAKDLFPDKKLSEYPKKINRQEFLDIIYSKNKNTLNLGSGQIGGILPIDKKEENERFLKDRFDKQKRLELLKRLKSAFENMSPMGSGWSKPGVQEEYWDLISELEGGFKPSGQLYNTPEPEVPKIVGHYIDKPGANSKVNWQYTRYENGEPVTYSFQDYKNGGGEYKKYYDQFLSDRKKWTLANTTHQLLTVAQIGALFIPVIGPAISAGLSLGEAALFKSQGDDFMAGLMVIFTVLPGASKLIPEFKGLSNPVKSKISKYITKGSRTTKLTPYEKEIADEIIKNQVKLKSMGILAKFYVKLRTVIHKMNPFTMMRFANYLINKNPVFSTLLGEGVKMGGITYTWKTIYSKYNKAKSSNDEKEISRIENAIKEEQTKIVNKLESPTSDEELKMQGVDVEQLDKDICKEFPEYC